MNYEIVLDPIALIFAINALFLLIGLRSGGAIWFILCLPLTMLWASMLDHPQAWLFGIIAMIGYIAGIAQKIKGSA